MREPAGLADLEVGPSCELADAVGCEELGRRTLRGRLFCHGFGAEMARRGRGGLILIASGTALQGSPRYANYAATKAFNLVLGESLWYEFREHGVDVLSFVPGPTNTPGLRRSVKGLKGHATIFASWKAYRITTTRGR